jgi:hypothetical protein
MSFKPPQPDGATRAQTREEKEFTQAASSVTLHHRCIVRGVPFNTAAASSRLSVDNSAVSAPWTDAAGEPCTIYGRIERIMSVCLDGSTRRVALHVLWRKHTSTIHDFIPVLGGGDRHLAKTYPVLWATGVYAQSIAIWPRDLRHADGLESCVVWRNTETGPNMLGKRPD